MQKGQAGSSLHRNHSQISSSAWNWGCQCPGTSSLDSPVVLASSSSAHPCPAPSTLTGGFIYQPSCCCPWLCPSEPQCHLFANTRVLPPPHLPMALHNPSTGFPAAQAKSQTVTQMLYKHLHDPLKTPSKWAAATGFPFQS